MSKLRWGALALGLAGAVASASAQTAPTGSALAPTAGRPAAPVGAAPGSSSAPHTQPTPSSLRMSAEAETAKRLTDERLRRRDAAARRSLQGICKGC